MNRLRGALAGVVAAVALVLACSGLASVQGASASPSPTAGHVVLADGNGNGGGSILDTGWGGGGS
ncbi:hypothetical protein KGQ20_30740 [Catenulispora sp. NF23]|uniref:Uncharacterized protein n=1 Tax=Catenulispora pinistramenti TaxID=2705254 RepID=A0ABS5L0L7_9ACTN|nr:hypothetical protein [Catenulispora pinistramenti]MBS2537143.1 hypothetical protein [Catenulispora pinistramenti]MBS2551868.1 hypothetical protein [Catenulispora pinistramenti]